MLAMVIPPSVAEYANAADPTRITSTETPATTARAGVLRLVSSFSCMDLEEMSPWLWQMDAIEFEELASGTGRRAALENLLGNSVEHMRYLTEDKDADAATIVAELRVFFKFIPGYWYLDGHDVWQNRGIL